MDVADDRVPSPTRRTFLGGTVGLLAGTRFAAARSTAELTVLTRNLYLGVDLSGLYDVESNEELRRTAGDLLARAERHPYDARMEAIATEIERTDPDVVALQEAVEIRKRPASASGEDSWNVVADLLERIESALSSKGLNYEVAASTTTTSVELAAQTDDGNVDMELTDRDAVLVKSDVETGAVRTGTYGASVPVQLPDTDREFTLSRGYCLVETTVNGYEFSMGCTHLESASAMVRRLQAEELLGLLPSEGPVVLAGDFNSGPGGTTGTYDRLTGRYADAWAAVRSDTDGYTCCQRSSLENDRSQLNERIDAVLYRGDIRPSSVERVGENPEDRVDVERDGETTAVWPSDHAGVVATFEIEPATPTPIATSTSTRRQTLAPAATEAMTRTPPSDRTTEAASALATATSPPASAAGRNPASATDETASESGTERVTAGDSSSNAGPGFGIVTAAVGLGLGALGRWRRD